MGSRRKVLEAWVSRSLGEKTYGSSKLPEVVENNDDYI